MPSCKTGAVAFGRPRTNSGTPAHAGGLLVRAQASLVFVSSDKCEFYGLEPIWKKELPVQLQGFGGRLGKFMLILAAV